MRPSTGYAAGVSLHPLAERFASVAENYERGRPEYAPAVIGRSQPSSASRAGLGCWISPPEPAS